MTFPFEKFCLKWNDFHQNIVSSYSILRKDSDFCDVTLVSQDDHQIEAHKIILTACSPFFSNVLRKKKHSHPLIYMRGLQAKDLVAMVDFIYYGEANIYQEDLDGFLALAEELQLKGLSGTKGDTLNDVQGPILKPNQLKPQIKSINGQKYFHQIITPQKRDITTNNKLKNNSIVPVDSFKFAIPVDTKKEDLKVQLDSMMEKAEDGEIKWICSVCEKSSKGKDWGIAKTHMREHIETHLEGLTYPCNQCGKVSR